IAGVADLEAGKGTAQKVALVVDVRAGDFMEGLATGLAEAQARGATTRVLFLDASDDVLVRRYEASRRRHPLADGDRVSEGIASERQELEELKGQADVVIDTSELNVHELRDRLLHRFADADVQTGALQTSVVSFGYKHGLPIDVDVVLDCRFLPNP